MTGPKWDAWHGKPSEYSWLSASTYIGLATAKMSIVCTAAWRASWSEQPDAGLTAWRCLILLSPGAAVSEADRS